MLGTAVEMVATLASDVGLLASAEPNPRRVYLKILRERQRERGGGGAMNAKQ